MGGQPQNPVRKYRFQEVVLFLFALLLLVLAVPRLWAYGAALPQDGQYWRLGEGERLSDGELADLLATYRTAADCLPSSPELQSRAAIVSVEFGLRHLRAEPIREGRDRLMAAASRAPLRTDIWSRLAYAEFASDGMTPLAVHALKLSWLTGRLELPDALRRLNVYLLGWDRLSADGREDAAAQLALLWDANHRMRVVELYASLTPAEREILRQLFPDPDAAGKSLARLERRLPQRD